MSKSIRLFHKTTGLNNVNSPFTGEFEPSQGITDLSVAVNVCVTNDGKIERRPGITALSITSSCHSLFSGRNGVFYVKGSNLYCYNDGGTSTLITTGLLPAYVSFCEVQDKTYYCNGFQKGYVKDNKSYAWTVGEYVGPATYRTFTDPPTGHFLGLYRGRLYVAKDTTLWFSEPFSYSAFDKGRNYIWFEYPVTVFYPVEDGIYVSTDKVYFLRGAQPDEFSMSVVSDYPIVGRTGVVIDGETIPGISYAGKSMIWTSRAGIYLGLGNGQVKNLTTSKIKLPAVVDGCAVYCDNKYLTFLRE